MPEIEYTAGFGRKHLWNSGFKFLVPWKRLTFSLRSRECIHYVRLLPPTVLRDGTSIYAVIGRFTDFAGSQKAYYVHLAFHLNLLQFSKECLLNIWKFNELSSILEYATKIFGDYGSDNRGKGEGTRCWVTWPFAYMAIDVIGHRPTTIDLPGYHSPGHYLPKYHPKLTFFSKHNA